MKQLSIVGIDPGTTSAYAVISLDGKMIRLNYAKEMTLSEIISEVFEVSTPMFVGTDKGKVPSFVSDFAVKVGAEVISPEEDLKKEDKRDLTKGYDTSGWKDHQLDSLAAAVFALRRTSLRLKRIERYVEENNLSEKKEEFTYLALREKINLPLIKKILDDCLKEPLSEAKEIKTKLIENSFSKKDFIQLMERFSRMEEEKNKILEIVKAKSSRLKQAEKENHQLKNRSQNFGKKLDQMLLFKEKRIKSLREEILAKEYLIRQRENENEQLRDFIPLMIKGILLKKLKNLSKEEFLSKQFLQIGEKDVLLVDNPAVYSEQVVAELSGKEIIVLSYGNLTPFIRKNFQSGKIVREDLIEENEHFALIKSERYKEIRKRIGNDLVFEIVEEYQEERKQLFKSIRNPVVYT
jgi:predicted RNase H-like nuclease (RuvC/YqgF family)